jgi:hypothetical protein
MCERELALVNALLSPLFRQSVGKLVLPPFYNTNLAPDEILFSFVLYADSLLSLI